MRRIVIALLSTISGVVLLFAYPTSTNRPLTDAAPAAVPGPAAASGTAAGGAPAPAGAAAAGTVPKPGTFTGGTAQTRWGPVQVRIVVAGNKVTSADAIQFPSGNGTDQQINSFAIPQLNSEVIAAQSAKIDMVSGATVTSGGYLKSLQDAIDQAFRA